MTKSMTGFASATGAADNYSWSWDLRSVNARGMDARLRLPDWIDGLEAALKPAIQKTVARGNVNLTLKVARDGAGQGVSVDSPKCWRRCWPRSSRLKMQQAMSMA